MRTLLLAAFAAGLTAVVPCTLADTMYKCVDANGKVAYSSMPCDGKAREARQFAVPPPEAEQDSSARLKAERNKLRVSEWQFRQRQAQRNAGYSYGGAGVGIANVPSARAQRQAQQDKAQSERAEAARLNAARIGNCSMRRPEANCL